jgi:uncharacterized membrane protein
MEERFNIKEETPACSKCFYIFSPVTTSLKMYIYNNIKWIHIELKSALLLQVVLRLCASQIQPRSAPPPRATPGHLT